MPKLNSDLDSSMANSAQELDHSDLPISEQAQRVIRFLESVHVPVDDGMGRLITDVLQAGVYFGLKMVQDGFRTDGGEHIAFTLKELLEEARESTIVAGMVEMDDDQVAQVAQAAADMEEDEDEDAEPEPVRKPQAQDTRRRNATQAPAQKPGNKRILH